MHLLISTTNLFLADNTLTNFNMFQTLLTLQRLEFAENFERRTQDVVSRQELAVEDARSKFNRVKELVIY